MPEQTETEKTVRDLIVTRVFKATPDLIWSAFTDPEQLVKFFGPPGTHIPLDTVTLEPHVGGAFNLVMHMDDHSQQFPMEATYVELVENEKIVFETTGGITGTIQLTPVSDTETEITWTTRAEFDDAFYKNAEIGTNGAIDNLGEHLAAIQS
jgi:uncharacterized protein YndB with AHSA1/START domain